MNVLPCINDKCLKYPICKHRDVIYCDELKEYFIRLVTVELNYNESFDFIHLTLPNLYQIRSIKERNSGFTDTQNVDYYK